MEFSQFKPQRKNGIQGKRKRLANIIESDDDEYENSQRLLPMDGCPGVDNNIQNNGDKMIDENTKRMLWNLLKERNVINNGNLPQTSHTENVAESENPLVLLSNSVGHDDGLQRQYVKDGR